MDLLTHGLAATVAGAIGYRYGLRGSIVIISGLIPDVGEIVIQRELTSKYGNALGVYDERTSDPFVAADQGVTWLYDLLHSLSLPFVLLLIALLIGIGRRYFISVSIGLLTHVFLDSFTHGKVWALKLFYPFSGRRFEILGDSVGNWWDWKPAFSILEIRLPLVCLLVWIVLLILYFIVKNLNTKLIRSNRNGV